jgi:ADP-heptose:LPS heptosyltransferase
MNNISIKNLLILFTVKILKLIQKKSVKGTSLNYFIVSTTALGDTLWATPAIRLLKEQNPGSKIFVLVTKTGQEVLKNNPYIHKIITLNKPFLWSLLEIYNDLKNVYFNKILIFHTSQRIILPFCYLLHSDEIAATTGINKGFDYLVSNKLVPSYEHEIVRRLRIAAIDYINKNLIMEIFPDNKAELEAVSFLKKHCPLKKIIIGIHPGATNNYKMWPIDRYLELVCLLKRTFDCYIIVTGSQNERMLAEKITSSITESFFLDEPMSIHAIGSLIKKFDLFITNDTGPMHLAFASLTKSIALFAPTDAHLVGPLNVDNSMVIQKEKTCLPCIKKNCLNPFCMLQISPQEVVNCAIKLLKPNLLPKS